MTASSMAVALGNGVDDPCRVCPSSAGEIVGNRGDRDSYSDWHTLALVLINESCETLTKKKCCDDRLMLRGAQRSGNSCIDKIYARDIVM
jgi:hypothetical protein